MIGFFRSLLGIKHVDVSFQLMDFARGKIVLALEGGYNLASISNSALACMEVLLDDKTVTGSTEAYPFESTWRVIQAVKCFFLGGLAIVSLQF